MSAMQPLFASLAGDMTAFRWARMQQLVFARRGVQFAPGPGKAFIGEDAFMVAERTQGVADGVGSFAEQGIDSGLLSQSLMGNAFEFTEDAFMRRVETSAAEILAAAASRAIAEHLGATTACIAHLRAKTHDGTNVLEVANLGDSGCLVLRPIVLRNGTVTTEVVFQSESQQQSFNHPYQLGRHARSTAADAALDEVEVFAGDIVLTATDGVLDNLYPGEIADICTEVLHNSAQRNKTVQDLCDEIIRQSKERSLDTKAATPFSETAIMNGCLHNGGKKDDMTLVASILSSPMDDNDTPQPPPYANWPAEF